MQKNLDAYFYLCWHFKKNEYLCTHFIFEVLWKGKISLEIKWKRKSKYIGEEGLTSNTGISNQDLEYEDESIPYNYAQRPHPAPTATRISTPHTPHTHQPLSPYTPQWDLRSFEINLRSPFSRFEIPVFEISDFYQILQLKLIWSISHFDLSVIENIQRQKSDKIRLEILWNFVMKILTLLCLCFCGLFFKASLHIQLFDKLSTWIFY